MARVQKMLGDELGTASNIKSRVNRQSVLGAITSAQQRLKLYNKVDSTGSLGKQERPVGGGVRLRIGRNTSLYGSCRVACKFVAREEKGHKGLGFRAAGQIS